MYNEAPANNTTYIPDPIYLLVVVWKYKNLNWLLGGGQKSFALDHVDVNSVNFRHLGFIFKTAVPLKLWN